MKKLRKEHLRAIKTISTLVAIFGGLSFYSFNCAPPSFVIDDQNSLSLSSTGVIDDTGLLSTKVSAPQALLTSDQIYESMMNLTGQKATVTAAQLAEYNRRSGSFGAQTNLEKINSPMLFALTSFAGEVCNGLVQMEISSASPRRFFQNINFSAGVSQISDSAYQDSVSKMFTNFVGRPASNDEVALFTQYKSDFIAAIASSDLAQAVQTRNLMSSTCAAMLSSFDVYTY